MGRRIVLDQRDSPFTAAWAQGDLSPDPAHVVKGRRCRFESRTRENQRPTGRSRLRRCCDCGRASGPSEVSCVYRRARARSGRDGSSRADGTNRNESLPQQASGVVLTATRKAGMLESPLEFQRTTGSRTALARYHAPSTLLQNAG